MGREAAAVESGVGPCNSDESLPDVLGEEDETPRASDRGLRAGEGDALSFEASPPVSVVPVPPADLRRGRRKLDSLGGGAMGFSNSNTMTAASLIFF